MLGKSDCLIHFGGEQRAQSWLRREWKGDGEGREAMITCPSVVVEPCKTGYELQGYMYSIAPVLSDIM